MKIAYCLSDKYSSFLVANVNENHEGLRLMKYDKLFTPGNIGSLSLKNRLVMTAMGCNLGNQDGTLGDAFLAYYRARAQGGVGLIVTETTRVNEEHGCMNPRQIRATHDSFIPEMKKLADTAHEFDCRVFLQLHHPGNVTYPEINSGHTPVSSSHISSRIKQQKIHPLTVSEISEIVKNYADAARRSQEAGIDGVEVQAGHFYLIHQFLSPFFNKRTDQYGGSFENRTRFLREIILAIRKTCGCAYPLMVRLSVDDYLGNEGYHLDEGILIARLLEELGVDAIDVTAAGAGSPGSQNVEPVSYQQGWRSFLGAAVKKAVKIPVCAVSLVRDPAYAEELLEKNKTDFVASGRCFLADPDYARKIQEGKENDIRKCISCLRCIETIKDESPLVCSVNPYCGRESVMPEPVYNGSGKTIFILGGGPAGLETARIAGERGFTVHLYEKTQHLGGSIYFASQIPHKNKMGWFIDWERRQCEKLGVFFHLGAVIDLEEIKTHNPFAVIDATGAAPLVPGSIPGINEEIVCTNIDILSGHISPEGEYIAVIGSGMTGLETAELLAEKGNTVVVIEMADTVAPGAYRSNVFDVLAYLNLHNVVVMTGKSLVKIGTDRIYLENTVTKEESQLPVDRVVLSMGVRPGQIYGEELLSVCKNIVKAGDSKKTGRLMEAVRSGNKTALEL
jgi:2,4-dienoyl-CoA reductase-like NADH-dependent reductase (Old Yellow Enzyme family)/thioredoxin reductase